MPWTCPKSWPRGRCPLQEGCGGSISRAVAHYSDPNVGVHLRRTLCAVMVERFVRNFILAVWLFHFPFKSKSPSPLHLCFASSRSVHFQCERQRSPAAHLVRRTVRRLVRIYFHGCSCPGPVPNRDRVVDALSIDCVEGPLIVRQPIIPIFWPVFAVIFTFCGIARMFSSIFSL